MKQKGIYLFSRNKMELSVFVPKPVQVSIYFTKKILNKCFTLDFS